MLEPIAQTMGEFRKVSYLGFGFWQAWSTLCYIEGFLNFASVPVPFGDGSQSLTSLLFTLCSSALVLTIVTLACLKSIDQWLQQPWFPLAGCLASTTATIVLSLAAAGVIEEPLLVYLSCILAGVGNAVLCLTYAPIIGSKPPRRSFLEVCYSMMLCCFIYFIAATSPFVVQCALCALCPLLSGLLALAGQTPETKKCATHRLSLTSAAWRLFVAVLILGSATALIRSPLVTTVYVNTEVEWTGLGTFVVLCICVVLVLIYGKSPSFYRASYLYYPISIFVIVFLLLIALRPLEVSTTLASLASTPRVLLNIVFDAIFFYIIYQSKMSPARIMGLGHGFKSFGILLGGELGRIDALGGGDAESRLALYLAMAFLVVVSIVLIAPEPILAAVLTPIEDEDARFDGEGSNEHGAALSEPESATPASHSSTEDGPADTSAPPAGKTLWKRRCELVCDTFKLTAREQEVLALLSKGHGSEYISEQLVISLYTARTHVRNIYSKTGVHSREELIQLIKTTEVDSTHYQPDRHG